jgi:anti-sigma-K factor RskA
MEDQRLDLSPLAARGDALERLAEAILKRAAPELRRRAAAAALAGALGAWRRPVLVAAAVVAVAAGTVLALSERPAAVVAVGITSMTEALRVPEPAVTWLEEGRSPTSSDLLWATEGSLP